MPGKRGTVLVVDDSADTAELHAAFVEREGFEVVACETAAAALAAFERTRPVAVLLDWSLPDGPGTEVCRSIRALDQMVTIIFISGREGASSAVRALDAGADDFLAKPVKGDELVARLDANLRKVAATRLASVPVPSSTAGEETLRFGGVSLDLGAHEASVGGRPVRLGPLEFKLLEYLARNSGIAVSRDQILNEVYGYDADITTERVDLLVRRLRAKLGDHEGRHIAAVSGFGYRLERRILD